MSKATCRVAVAFIAASACLDPVVDCPEGPSCPLVPGAATGVEAAPGVRSVSLSWVAPVNTGNPTLAGYRIVSSTSDALAVVSDTRAVIAELANGTEYSFGVAAFNDAGESSLAFSNVVKTLDLPGSPDGVSAVPGPGRAFLRWTAPVDVGGTPVAEYRVKFLDGGVALSTPGIMGVVDQLANGVMYEFTVSAANAVGEGPPSLPSSPVVPRTVPHAPTGVKATGGNRTAMVRWQAPRFNGGSDVTGYIVRFADGGTAGTTTGPTEAAVTGLTNGERYRFSVIALNVAGPSLPSQPSNRVTPTEPCLGTPIVGEAPVVLMVARQTSIVVADFDGDAKLDLGVGSGSPGMGFSVTFGNGNGTFRQPGVFVTGALLRHSRAADINSDGRLDIIGGEDRVFWALLGQGDGGFEPAAGFPVVLDLAAVNAHPLLIADFNRDGRPDIVAAASEPRIMLGVGDGGFQAPVYLESNVPVSASAILPASAGAVADFNADGKDDLAYIDERPDYVALLLGNGDGTFMSPSTSVSGRASYMSPTSIVAGDFNADGRVDLARADVQSSAASLLLGNGNGTFQAPINFMAGGRPLGLASGDMNGDGNLDLVIPDRDGPVRVFAGNGNGTFRPHATVPVASGFAWSTTTADFNGDGRTDLAIMPAGNPDVSIVLTGPNGKLYARATFDLMSPGLMHAADFNGDDRLDLVVIRANVGLMLASADGGFGPLVDYQVGNAPGAPVSGDLNGDGALELLVPNFSDDDFSVLIGESDGGFAAHARFPAGDGPAALSLADFDKDGLLDVAVVNSGGSSVSLLMSTGDGGLQPRATFPVGMGPIGAVVGDFNRDGRADLSTANSGSNDVSVMLGDGAGGLASQATFGAGLSPRAVVAADFNADGAEDLALLAPTGPVRLTLLLSDGTGRFAAPRMLLGNVSAAALAADDIDADGKMDLVVLTNERADLLRGNGDGTFRPPLHYSAGLATLINADLDGDGKVDLVTGGFNRIEILLNQACIP